MIRSDRAIHNVHIGDACLLCRNPNDIIDTEVSIPYEGVLAICTKCVGDLAICAGYDITHTLDEWNKLVEEHSEAVYTAESVVTALNEVASTAQQVRRKHRNRVRQWKNRSEGSTDD